MFFEIIDVNNFNPQVTILNLLLVHQLSSEFHEKKFAKIGYKPDVEHHDIFWRLEYPLELFV